VVRSAAARLASAAAIAAVCVLAFGGADRGASAGSDPIRIGAVFSETGGLRSIGSPGLAGMRLAAAQINARGGVLGRRVQIAAADSRSKPAAVVHAVRRLIENERVVALGGLNDSTLALAAGPVAQRAGVPFVTAGATLPTLPRTVGNAFFMAAFGDDAQAHAVAEVARTGLRARSAFLLVDRGSDFTRALARFFRQGFVARGGTVTGRLTYAPGERDFASAIARIRAQQPPADVLFFSALPSEAGRLTRQARAAGLTQPILSGDGFDTPLLGRVAGTLADNVYYSTHVALDSIARRIRRFVTAYRERYGRKPENAFAALGYDTMRLIADAIRRAGSPEPAAIRRALAATRGFAMVTGTISYAPGRRTPKKPVTIMRVRDGRPAFYRAVVPRLRRGGPVARAG
jgi:branched-chain amino acid transport system substrate-binding protein